MHPLLKRILQITGITLWVVFLTILTQVGGLVYLIARFSSGWLKRRIVAPWKLRLARLAYGFGIYLIVCLLLVPVLAKPLGRVPLPIWSEANLKPLRLFTVLLNRHYVRADLRNAAIEVADEMGRRYPGTTLYYLDANFPFWDGFPLVPHLSHDDGKKLDLAFLYADPTTGELQSGSPSWLGYGVCEGPRPDEQDQPEVCAGKGYWQYNFMQSIVPQWSKEDYKFDAERTKTLIRLFADQPQIGMIFIEPHLKTRLKLDSPKLRYHGCQAVRHDDHIHVQIQ